MRIIVATCEAEYTGRLHTRLPEARRVILVKADQSVLVLSEAGSSKPLNWMVSPCRLRQTTLKSGEILQASALKSPDTLVIRLSHVFFDRTFKLGREPGITKDGVEDDLQHLLAEQIGRIGGGARLVRREYPTPVGPVDIMAVNRRGEHVAVEVKRHGGIDGVEQLSRYVHFLRMDSTLTPVRGLLAAQTITPQARVLARSRGLGCLILDYEDMKRQGESDLTLF